MDKTIFLITIMGKGQEKDIERLVKATTRSKAIQHVMGVNKAQVNDVARVMASGATVEDAAE